ncbi:MAG: alpha/beta hydrolase [Pseudomonadales bacterium]
MLLCDTFGSDRMNLHLAYRYLALQLSHAGFACLRVDYPGTGDSAGMPRDTQSVAVWTGSLSLAADHLRARSGADNLALFGARFGGTMAALLAAARHDVMDLILWGPFVEGRQFLRQCRAVQRMLITDAAGRAPNDRQPGDQESMGFLLTGAWVEELEPLNLTRLERAPAQRACVLPWDDTSRMAALADAWRGLGVEVEIESSPLFDAQRTLQQQAVPWPILDHVDRWLCRSHATTTVARGETAGATPASVSIEVDGEDTCVIEQAVYLAEGKGLFGILSRPSRAPERVERTGILLVNGGNNHRPGINRNGTEWARRWAAQGWPVLRMDIRGLGDSPPAHAEDLNVLYRSETTRDVLQAMDWMQERLGIRRFIVGGLCAGAYQALHTGVADRRVGRVVGLFLLELLRYYPDRGLPRQVWRRKLLRARQRLDARLPIWCRRSTRLGRWMGELCRRGVKVLAVFNEADGMDAMFRWELGRHASAVDRGGRLRFDLVPDGNHIFSPLWCQQEITASLDRYLAEIAGAEAADVQNLHT